MTPSPAAVRRLLIVKTSSMGDVVHALPVLADLHAARPGVVVDWLVEAPFAAIPALHPGVAQVVPMAWRRWRSSLLEPATRAAMAALRAQLREARYDLVLDLQGLLKSALWARQSGAPVAGYDRGSAREPLAAWLYARRAPVPQALQAVQRCRALAAAHLGYRLPDTAAQFGLRAPAPSWQPRGDYAVLVPGASRAAKLWPERRWVAVGQRLRADGCLPVVLWGSEAEQTLAERIAASCDGDVPPFLKVGEAAALLAGARVVVGLDTGFSHLAAALGRPTLGIYCDHDPGRAGLTGDAGARVISLGGKGQVPAQAEVLAALAQIVR